jgi:hypothetical protein
MPVARSRRFSAVLLALLLLPATLAAQKPGKPPKAPKPDKPDTGEHKPARLFRGTEPVVMWLSADFKTVFKDRDSMSTKTYPATLRYLDEKGDTLSLDVQLSTRGHFRLKTCSVVPLKVHFDKEKTRGTLFGGNGSLKLATHCEKGDDYAQRVYIEYAIYKMYRALTPVGLDARLATVTWIDPKNPSFTVTRPGFWMQDDDDMARVLRGKILMQQGGHAEDMDPRQMTITDVFQYMIGNTDYSMSYLHNYRIVLTDTAATYYPMAYDWDWSGLVDAPYARPDSRLPIRTVRDRLYRGACHSMAELTPVLELFKAKKGEIYGALTGLKPLDPKRLKVATEYLDEFFKMIDDPRQVNRELRQICPQ